MAEHTGSDVTAADVLATVHPLAPQIAEWRGESERERHLPRQLVEALRDAGLFALAVPRALGGADIDDVTLLRLIEELARQDGSVAWNVMIAAHGAWIALHLPRAGLRQVYAGGPSTIFAGSLVPKGVAVPVAGGFCLTGHWPMASGCQQADWLLAPSTIMVNGAPRLRPDGRPEVRACYLPAAECEILDTWWTTGLRGTGSHDVRVSGAFVPQERSFPLLFAGQPEPGSLSVSRFSVRARPNIAAVALGIARDAIDSFTELARTRTPTQATATLATHHTIHERVGRAEALVRAGRAFVQETLRALPTTADWSVDLSDEVAAQIRLASAHAAHSAAEAVDLLFTAGGTTSIYTQSRLERCFRDVHTVTQHVGVAASNIETVGQYLLGLGLDVGR